MAPVHQAIRDVMRSVGAIQKRRENQQQGFTFRGIDDVYNAFHPALVEHGVVTVPEVLSVDVEERATRSGGVLRLARVLVRYTIFGPDGDSIQAVVAAEGADVSDKAVNKALSTAHKYLFFQTFAVPTDEPDADAETHEVAPPPTLAPQAERSALKERAEALVDAGVDIARRRKQAGLVPISQATAADVVAWRMLLDDAEAELRLQRELGATSA